MRNPGVAPVPGRSAGAWPIPGSEQDADPWRTVVGVVENVRWQGPASEESATLYLPLAQHVGAIDAMSVILHAGADPSLVTGNLRAMVASLDAETPVSGIRTVDDVVAQAVSRPRFTCPWCWGSRSWASSSGWSGSTASSPTRPRAGGATSASGSPSERPAPT